VSSSLWVLYFEKTIGLIHESAVVHCSMLAEDAIKSAISNYYSKNPTARQTDLGGTSAPLPKVEVETVAAASAST
jgi:iron-sulfur cluster assembly enzyme ISCU, mitochondrial